jgi:hypothetical protein
MANRNIFRFITNNGTSTRKLRQSIGAKVIEMAVLDRRKGGGSSKGIVCGGMRSTCDRKTDGVKQPRAIAPGDHVPSSEVLHRETKRVKFH